MIILPKHLKLKTVALSILIYGFLFSASPILANSHAGNGDMGDYSRIISKLLLKLLS